VLIAQDGVLVEHHVRQEDEAWLLRKLRAGDTLKLVSLGCEIPLSAIYRKVLPASA
jgi:hypothetical protein